MGYPSPLRAVRARQPEVVTPLNRAHPFVRRRWNFINIPGLLLTGDANPAVTFLTNASYIVGPAGRRLDQSGSLANSGVDYASNAGLQLSVSSGVIVFESTSDVTFGGSLLNTRFGPSGPGGGFYLDVYQGKFRMMKMDIAGILESSNAVLSTGIDKIGVGVWSYNNVTGRVVIAYNGVLTTGVSAQTFTHGVTNQGGYYTNSALATVPTKIYFTAISPDECFDTQAMIDISLNPYAFFTPQMRSKWVNVAAAPSGFVPAWAQRGSRVIGAGVH